MAQFQTRGNNADPRRRKDTVVSCRGGRGGLPVDAELKTATTDNGCEVSHQKALERILGCPVYYTRAYASYEKGDVETIVNSIHRLSLKGETAYDCHSRLAKTL